MRFELVRLTNVDQDRPAAFVAHLPALARDLDKIGQLLEANLDPPFARRGRPRFDGLLLGLDESRQAGVEESRVCCRRVLIEQ